MGKVSKMMTNTRLVRFSIIVSLIMSAFSSIFAQGNDTTPMRSREISDDDGIPVLIKHLPDWENALKRTTYILNRTDLRNALGEKQVFELIEFESGTEAVTAPYEQGKLLIVEFSTPQASVDADEKIKQTLAETVQSPPIFYRRIGNYNAFVFDTTDEAAANILLDQIKYEKNVHWLGSDPFLLKRAERAFVLTTSDIFVTTTVVIVGGLGFSVLAGIIVGIFFFYLREQKRSTMTAFSDAGGMTRLNLDGFTPQNSPDRLLKD